MRSFAPHSKCDQCLFVLLFVSFSLFLSFSIFRFVKLAPPSSPVSSRGRAGVSLGVDFFLAQPLGSHFDSRDVVHQVSQALIVGESDAAELLRVTVDMRRF